MNTIKNLKTVKENLENVVERVQYACQKAGRDRESVTIIPVTKTVDIKRIKEAIECGYHEITENKVQEAENKANLLKGGTPSPIWHFVGHLQSNKVNKVVQFASMIQSIDRMKMVKKLNKQLNKLGKNMPVLIQINVSGEDSKYGLHPDEALSFIEQAAAYEHIKIKGLMTIGLFSDDWPEVRKGFRLLRELRDNIEAKNIPGVEMDILSMGMTNDFEIAIEEGATMVRIGRAIFGERDHPDSYYWPGIGTENVDK